MKQLTVSALSNPSMLARIRLGMRLAALGKGEQMGGHSHRVYVPNRHGRNVMRIDWNASTKSFVFYGNESVRIDSTIKRAFTRASVARRYGVAGSLAGLI